MTMIHLTMLRSREIVLIVFIAVVALGSIVVYCLDPEDVSDTPAPDAPVIPDDGVGPSLPDGSMGRVGDLYVVDPDGLFTISSIVTADGSTEYSFVLRDDLASQYVGFKWYIEGASYYGETTVKTEPEATWTVEEGLSGEFTVNVRCTLPDTGSWFTYTRTYSADLYLGHIEREFVWIYGDYRYTMTVGMDYPTYLKYDGTNGARLDKRAAYGNGTYSVVNDFMVVDDTVGSIARDLMYLYSQVYGTPTGQGYAEFVLAFVQSCFRYTEDIRQYGQEEYFAYPLETVYSMAGDCEDLSILYATVMDASGYDSGVFLIPGHAIGAVTLDVYVPGSVSAQYSGSVGTFSMTHGGATYYGCETTLGSNAYGVGWIDSDYGLDAEGNVTYQGVIADRDLDYGLYPLKNDATPA